MELPSLESAVSAIWVPGMDEAEWEDEFQGMCDRAFIVNEFMQGRVQTDSFLDWIAQEYADPLEVFGLWVPG
ncbi:MAG: hypothetical protein B0A82_05790 [Alkalinema sp. CACIAM 70d]|nr:MAG: hypothetical protein B0A82_05790 [Alkalinema sp. CACIAM 70d]